MAVKWDDFTPVGVPKTPTTSGVDWSQFTPADESLAATESSAIRRGIADPAISLLKGAISVPEAAVGIANIPTLGLAGKAAEGIGFRPEEAKAELDTWYSPEQQAVNRRVQEAQGFMPTLQAAVQNPSVIGHTVAESVPSMMGGAAIARGLLGAGSGALARTIGSSAAPTLAAATGEGIVGAGMAAEQIRQGTSDGTLSPRQVAAALASGVGTGVIGAAGGMAARKLGLSDVDTMLAGGAGTSGTRSLPARVLGGAISEGVLEEMPQSAQEQAWQNIALGKPAMEGVPEQAAIGGLSGAAMGGVGGIVPRRPSAPGPLQKAVEASAATAPIPDTQTAGNPPGNMGIPRESPGNPPGIPRKVSGAPGQPSPVLPQSLGGQQSQTAPQQQNTPAAPGVSPAPVSTAAPSPITNQAEPAGVPVSQPQEGAVPRGNETEIAQPAAPGQQAQPAAVSGAAWIVGNAGTPGAIPASNTVPQPPSAGQDVNLQNRDRSRTASVIQMSEIARNPDYMRLGPSRTPDSGAPMVFAVGDDLARIPATNFGNNDVAVMSDGQRVPFRYAVVGAGQVEPSNFADGRVNPAFAAGQTGTIKALNNGRTAGLRAAYELGSAGTYQTELAKDLVNVGISPGALQATPNPILVRVYSDTANTAGMAAKSQAQGLGMSPAELARQDATLLDSSVLSMFRPGDVAAADNRDFVRAFVGGIQQSGQDIAGMMTDAGTLSPTGRQRIQAALMQAAYGDADLVADLFDSIETDIKSIGEALKAVSGAWANMRDSARLGAIAPEVDITPHLMAAVRLIQQARRDRAALYDLANQRDIETGEPPSDLTLEAMRLFYTGHYLTRPVAKETLTGNLERYLELAMATSPGADMFGEKAESEKLLQAVTKKEAPDEERKGREQRPAAATHGAGAGGGRTKAQRQRGAGGGDSPASSVGAGGAKSKGDQDAVIVPPSAPAAEAEPNPAPAENRETPPADLPDLALRGQTPEEVVAAEAEAKAAADKEAKARRDAEKSRKDAEASAEIKRRSDAAAQSFELGGDALANLSGQGDMFGAPNPAVVPSPEPTSNAGELPPDANAASDDLGALFDNELEAAFSKPKEEGNEPGSVRNPQQDREATDAQRGDARALSDERGRESATPGGGVPVPDADRQGGRPGGPGVSGVGAASGGERGDQPVPGTKRSAGVKNLPARDNQRQGSAAVRQGGVAASGWESAAAVGGPAGGGVGPRSASEAGKSAAKNAGLALSDVAKGLNALFNPKHGQLGMGVPFDEDTYAAAKPYFQAGLAHFSQAGADIMEMMRALIAALRDQFGMDKDTIAAMKPYVLRYISDVQAGRDAIEETNPQQPPKDKLQQQQAAESIDVVVGDKANVDATLPFLTEGQREDVLFAEKRWSKPDGYGVLFTNGTGTGKTFLALGAIKRLAKRGNGNGIIVVPNEAVMNEWVKSAPAIGLQIKPLSDTKDGGSGIAITTYANFGQNDEIAKRDYDFVAIDEAHLLMLGKDAEPTKALDALRAVSLHPDGVLQRAEMQNRELVDRIRDTSVQLTAISSMMNNPDIMDQMYAAYRAEADGLEKKLAEYRAKWNAALDAVESDVMARQGERRTRTIFLSATPFAYEPSIQWGEGYLYEFPQVSGSGYNAPSGYQKFMMQHFGWRMRNGKLNKPSAEVDSDLMQRQFNTWLRKGGVLSARMLDVDHDYERKFILIHGGVGQTIDDGLRWLRETDNGRYWSIYHDINEQFDYLTRSRLLEAIKARAAIPYIKKHHALGRKVVVFYDFNSGGGINVFNLSEQLKRADAAERNPDYDLEKDGAVVPVRGQGNVVGRDIKHEKVPASQLIKEFMAARPELQAIDFSQYRSPLTTLLEAFPGAGVYNGMSQYKKTRIQSIRDFNDDAKPGANLLLVQKAANAGWSGHDTTGRHGRILINLGLPVAPIEAIQEEGRIYRVGQKSDANFQYFNTGTNWERYAFGSKIARRAGTAENLAMGEQARGLREAFIQAFENSDPDYEPSELNGKGGKAGDRDLVNAITEWDRARTLYFAQQKRTSRTKAAEGVDYYATPEPLGLKMVEWAGILTGDRVLEPSAGHGAIARWFPEKSDRTVIEPSLELASRLTLATDAKLINERFEGHDTINKYDAIVMNPPFGAGGKTAIEHLDKAFRHLADGGRVVALIPEGPAANKRLDDWLYGDKKVNAKPVAKDVGEFGSVFMGDTVAVEVSGMAGIAGGVLGTATITGKVTGFREGKLFVKREEDAWATGYRADQIRAVQPTGARTTMVKSAPNAYLRASIGLPVVTFERTGTVAKTRVVIIDKIEGMRASRGVETQPESEIEAATVNELFDRLENMEVVGRSLPAHKEKEKQQGQERSAAKDATSGKVDDVGIVQPDGSAATIEQLQKPEKAGGKTKLLTDAPRVKHVVASSGKELFGVIAKKLTKDQAKSIDPYSWPKNGGFFIRMEHVVRPKSVAEQERSVYNVHEPDGITGDLFRETTPDLFAGTDNALPAAARTNLHGEGAATARTARPAPGPAARVLAVRQAPDAPGLYYVSTQLVTVGERELPVWRISSTEDAAKAFAYLPRWAVEHYDAIVTDKDGKPLATIGGFKGDVGSTIAPPSALIAELSRIDGASKLWTAHNHPSGMATLSDADVRLDKNLQNALDGSDIEYHGLFAMVGAGSRTGVVKYDHTMVGPGEVRVSRRPLARVPIVDRELTDRRDDVEKLDHPAKAKSVIPQIAGDLPGVVFLDSQNGVSAFVPFSGDEMGSLRVQGRLMRLFRAASKANARSAIVADPGGRLSAKQVGNLATALNNVDINLLDAVSYDPGGGDTQHRSWAERGDIPPMYNPGNVVFSAASAGTSASPADRAIFSMVADGKPADEILSFISKSSRRPFNRVLATALRRAGLASSITLDTAARFGKQQGAARYAAAYNTSTDTVALFTYRDTERHVLHELVHAATMKAIAAGGTAAVRMRALFRHVQKSGRLDGQYGMSNVDEFVAEAFSNPRFQDALTGIPAPEGSTLKSAWQWFVRIVARAIGIKTQAAETALDRALKDGAALMQENVNLAAVRPADGTFDPADPDIRFNLATEWSQTPVGQTVAAAIRDARHSDAKLSPFNLVQSQHHKAARLAAQGRPWFKRVFDAGQRFLSDISRIAVTAESKAPTLLKQIKSAEDVRAAIRNAASGDFGKQTKADVAAIAAPLYEGTLAGGGNPMKGVVWSDERLRSMFNLNDRQVAMYREALAAVNSAMDEFATALIVRLAKSEKVEVEDGSNRAETSETITEDLRLRADVLQQDIEATYQGRVDAANRLEGNKKTAAMNDAATKRDASMRDVERIKKVIEDIGKINEKTDKLQMAGYFPLKRFGKHTVTARDRDGKVQHFSMHDGIPLVPRSGQFEANRLANELRAANPEWTVETDLMNAEKYKLFRGINIDALQLFADHLDDDTKRTYQEVLRLATNNNSALKQMIHRKGMPGFDRDVRRTLASYILSTARYAASARHLGDMAKAAEMANEDGGDVGAEAVKLYEYVSQPQEEAAKLRGFLFFNFLGGSLAAAMVNATQVPVVTFPTLAQYENPAKLAKRLAYAAKLAMRNPANVPGAIGRALQNAEEDGVTAPHQVYEMTATATNNVFAGSRLAGALLRGWGAPFTLAESFNRRVTFIAAYQIGSGMTAEQLRAADAANAFEFAENMVNETQFIYNRGNRANVGRGAIGATVMTFKQFSIMYLELFSRLPPKQKAIMAGMLILAAGAGGLPFAEDIEDIIDTIGQWLGYRTNTGRTIRTGLESFVGHRVADIAMNGLLSQLGIDLHSRLGLQNMVPGTAIMMPSSTDKEREVQEFLGPAASVIASLGTALQNLATGKFDKAALAVSPVAVQNAFKGAGMLSTGMAEDAGGKPTVRVNAAEGAAKAIGFNPKAVADRGRINRDVMQDERLMDVWRERFTASLVAAIVAGDDEERANTIRELAEWNKEHPGSQIAINPVAVRKRVAAMKQDGATRLLKTISPAMRQSAAAELAVSN